MELSLNRHDAITTVSKFMKKFTKEHYDIKKKFMLFAILWILMNLALKNVDLTTK